MEPRHAPILAIIPPPALFAVTFLAGVGVDRPLRGGRFGWRRRASIGRERRSPLPA